MADIDKHQVLVKKNLNSIANEVYSKFSMRTNNANILSVFVLIVHCSSKTQSCSSYKNIIIVYLPDTKVCSGK